MLGPTPEWPIEAVARVHGVPAHLFTPTIENAEVIRLARMQAAIAVWERIMELWPRVLAEWAVAMGPVMRAMRRLAERWRFGSDGRLYQVHTRKRPRAHRPRFAGDRARRRAGMRRRRQRRRGRR